MKTTKEIMKKLAYILLYAVLTVIYCVEDKMIRKAIDAIGDMAEDIGSVVSAFNTVLVGWKQQVFYKIMDY